jgi:hypothetical protein
MVPDYEKLGLFYLGKRYDLTERKRLDEYVLYDSKDLVTHAVCVGMTGSGKTGLGIGLIEEAAIDGIPVLAIDPKGDLPNLLLTFPNLAPTDFVPWIDRGQAERHGLASDALAAQTATQWRAGLEEWGEDGARIARLRQAAEVRVYTPGSRAGTPLALFGTLGRSAAADPEDAQASIATTASGLLGLAGFTDVVPHSREQALISAILASGAPGPEADLRWLVQQIQRPAFTQVGVLDLETFYPARERQELALRFNSLLAAPGFDAWNAGEPLDAASMLFTAAGRPRIAIVSIAHLGDAERMLVVSMLLNSVLQWTRRQGGTGSLRALIYMDEVMGYLPPVANPPSKLPLLTLLKQARAFGVGIVLATQNPVDLDYKALSNTGTWFLGKLQTERDKDRVLDGLEGVAGSLDRQALDKTLSALRSRVFLMHNVHEREPVTFETRWTLSYLRGPMSREDLRRAIATPAAEPVGGSINTTGGSGDVLGGSKDPPLRRSPEDVSVTVHVQGPTGSAPASGSAASKPVLPVGVQDYYLRGESGTPTEYAPVLYGAARVHYTDQKRGIDVTRSVYAVVDVASGPVPVDWQKAVPVTEAPDTLSHDATNAAATYRPLPAAGLDEKRYVKWTRDFGVWLARAQALRVFVAPSLKLASMPDETERDFQVRVQHAMRESRDDEVEALRASYAPKLARVAEKARKAQEIVGREEQQVDQQKLQTAFSIGATMLGALMGRKAASISTLGRATTAARGVGRSLKESQDVAKAKEKQAEAQQELAALEAKLEEDIAAIGSETAAAVSIETVEIKPKRGAVEIQLVALAWRPIAFRTTATPGSPTAPTP